MPLRIGAPGQFALVRERLRTARFDERSVCAALGVEHLWRLGELAGTQPAPPQGGDDALGLLVSAFLRLERVPVAAARQLLGAREFDAFDALGLLVPSSEAGMCEAPVLLYPVADLVLASDRHRNADGSALNPPPDAVFPAIFPGTTRFLRLLPTGSFDAALDLGSGTGVAALILAAVSRGAVAADITERAGHFAEFNRRLNDRLQVEVVCGDLYQPVADRDFDCIVAHPPYMPTASDSFVFRDGGETGESLLQQIVTGLPRHLRAGGTFLALSAAWDTEKAPFESRVREWLGEHGDPDEYHVFLAIENEMPAAELAEQLERRARGGGDRLTEAPQASRIVRDAKTWTARFAELGLSRHVYGALAIARRPASDARRGQVRQPRGGTRRTILGASADGAAVARALSHMAWRAEQEAAGTLSQTLAALRPRLATEARLHVTYAPRDGVLAPVDTVMEREEPFRATTRVEPWMLSFIGAFDGQLSLGELHAKLSANGALPEGFGLDALVEVAGQMLERGYLDGEF